MLKLNEDGKFKIIQITDLHYGENEVYDMYTQALMEGLFDLEQADLAVLTGDMVSGYAWDNSTGWYETQWKNWTKAFINRNQTYMYIQGNHDSQADFDRDSIADLDMEIEQSITEKGPKDINGTSNYVKTVYDSTGTKKLFYLWAFDSMSDNCQGVLGYGCVYPNQIEWYRQKSAELIAEDDGKVIPGYAFFHIPLQEFLDMWNLNDVYGNAYDPISCQSVDTGLYAEMRQIGNIEAIVVGHDHQNDYWGEYNGMKFYFGRKTGYGGYGPHYYQRGARVFEFSLENDTVKMDTWIRQEDGSILAKQPRYPRFLKSYQWQTYYCDHMKLQEKYFIQTGFNKPNYNFATNFIHYYRQLEEMFPMIPSLEQVDDFIMYFSFQDTRRQMKKIFYG